MSNVVLLEDNPDPKEVEKRERAAWRECERIQTLYWDIARMEDELADKRAAYERLRGRDKAAWGRVHELFGGDYRRYLRWDERRRAE
jgi:hypothetical protein